MLQIQQHTLAQFATLSDDYQYQDVSIKLHLYVSTDLTCQWYYWQFMIAFADQAPVWDFFDSVFGLNEI